MLARTSLILFWLILTIMGLIIIKRKRTGDMSGFGGGLPSDIPRWGYVVIPLALLGFFYLSALTVLYIWIPALVTDFVFLKIPLDIRTTNILINIGGGLTLLGALILLTAFFHLGSSIRLLLPEERTQLVTDGWYAHSRNPFYLGLHIAMIGWIFIFPGILTIVMLVIFLINQHFRILLEEEFLEKQFEDEYREYKKRVRRYL